MSHLIAIDFQIFFCDGLYDFLKNSHKVQLALNIPCLFGQISGLRLWRGFVGYLEASAIIWVYKQYQAKNRFKIHLG